MIGKYKLKGLLSVRGIDTWQSWQLVFDWEDVFSAKMKLPIVSAKRRWYHRRRSGHYVLRYLFRLLRLDRIYNPKKLYIYHQMLIQNEMDYSPWMQKKIIVWVIDSFIEKSELPGIYEKYKLCPFLIISSLEAYNFLKKNNCPLKIYYVPLSLPDKYRINNERFHKKYDLISTGRVNPVLEKYVEQYLSKNRNLNFVSFKIENGNFYYYSTIDGELGIFNTREEYIDLLKQCKIGLYSTPGIDGGSRSNNKGFNPVTPRFFEFMSCQCHIITRYPDTEETQFFKLSRIAPHIDSYENFEKAMDRCLKTEVDLNQYRTYLEGNYTSTRITYLEEIFEEYNSEV